jgi:hypothetical protein
MFETMPIKVVMNVVKEMTLTRMKGWRCGERGLLVASCGTWRCYPDVHWWANRQTRTS